VVSVSVFTALDGVAWYKLLTIRLIAEGMFLAQYQVLRDNGHSPSEAFNETVEEATQSLVSLASGAGNRLRSRANAHLLLL
jgi:hypothetical protein